MKKFFKTAFSVLGIILLVMMIFGQIAKTVMKPSTELESQRSEFKKSLERADRDCPIPAAMGKGAVTGIKLENDFVTYYLSYEPDFFNILSRLKNDEKVREGLFMCFMCINAQSDSQGDLFVDTLIKLGYGLRIVITESAIGRFECSATVEEIKALRDKYSSNPHEALYNLLSISIESEQANLPMKIDTGLLMTDYKLENNNIIIGLQVDENLYSIDYMYSNRESIKASMIEEGLSQPESKAIFDLCKISHTGIVYRIIGNYSHKKIEIEISGNEIRQIVQTPSTLNIQ